MANNSTGNTTFDEEEILNTPPTPWIVISVLIAVCLTTVLSNLAVITSLILEPRLREPFNYLLLNLAISDLIVGGFGMSYLTVYSYDQFWPLGYKHCTFWMYMDFLGVDQGLLSLGIISMDRLWATVKPISYRQYNTTRKAMIAIVLSWVCVNAGILPGQIYDRLYNQVHYYKYDCFWDFNGPTVWASPLYVVPLNEWIPTLLVIICYAIITIKICQSSKRRVAQVGNSAEGVKRLIQNSTGERRRLKEKQAYVLLSLLFTALVLCWGPWFVYSGLSTHTGYYDWMVYMVTYWLGYVMSMLNPFLFNIANPDMRQTVRCILRYGKVKRTVMAFPRSGTTNHDNQSQPNPDKKSAGLMNILVENEKF
jgi:7 transmembrane receptor (rhodopsin family)